MTFAGLWHLGRHETLKVLDDFGTAIAAGEADTWTRAAQIGVPVHAVNGAVDSPDHLDMAERLVDTGTTITIEGTAHYPNMERPEQFHDALRELLRTL